MALAFIINQFDTFILSDILKENYCQITPIYIDRGNKAYGQSAGAGEIHFTLRTNRNVAMKKIEIASETIDNTVAKKNQLDCAIKRTQGFQANENDETAVNIIRKSATKNQLELLEKNYFQFGFSQYSNQLNYEFLTRISKTIPRKIIQ